MNRAKNIVYMKNIKQQLTEKETYERIRCAYEPIEIF